MAPPSLPSPPEPPSRPATADGDWRKVTVEGWIYRPSTSPTKRDGFDLVVSSDEGENLRRSPNGPMVGRAREGTLLERVGERGKWFRVRRDGWVPAARRCRPGRRPIRRGARQAARRPGRDGRTAGRPSPRSCRAPRRRSRLRVRSKAWRSLRATGLSRAPDSTRSRTFRPGRRPRARPGGRVGAGAGRRAGCAGPTSSPPKAAPWRGSARRRCGPRPTLRGADARLAAPDHRGAGRRRAPARDARRPAVSADPRPAPGARLRLRDHPAGARSPSSGPCRRSGDDAAGRP